MPKKTPREYTPIVSLKQLIDRNAAERYDKVLFRYFANKNELCEMTYGQFTNAVYSLIDSFKALGLEGKRIAVTGDTCPEWLIAYYAAIVCGGVAIPMDKELKGSEMAGFMKIGEADAIVYTKSVAKQFDEFYHKADCVKYYFPVDFDSELYEGKEDVIDFNTLIKNNEQHAISYNEDKYLL